MAFLYYFLTCKHYRRCSESIIFGHWRVIFGRNIEKRPPKVYIFLKGLDTVSAMLIKNYWKAPFPPSDLKIIGFLYLRQKPDRKSIDMVKLQSGITPVLIIIFWRGFFFIFYVSPRPFQKPTLKIHKTKMVLKMVCGGYPQLLDPFTVCHHFTCPGRPPTALGHRIQSVVVAETEGILD